MDYSQPRAKVIADSISHHGVRLTTIQVRMHKFVLQEFNTHRMLSRNAASTRARPVSWVLEQVANDPAMPVYWGRNQKGMQASGEVDSAAKKALIGLWREAAEQALQSARSAQKWTLHKQTANRLLEPWMWADVVVTATDWKNFFNLRCHPAAQPEMRVAAEAMRSAMEESTPALLSVGDWHLPYVSEWEIAHCSLSDLLAFSTARCARVSVKPFDKAEVSPVNDTLLHRDLLGNGHMSPFEHPAQAMASAAYIGNFQGWEQYRKTLPGEAIFRPSKEQ